MKDVLNVVQDKDVYQNYFTSGYNLTPKYFTKTFSINTIYKSSGIWDKLAYNLFNFW